MSEAPTPYFRKCTSCKVDIGWSARYYVCNVSTCNRKRTGLVFCSVSCWDAHLPIVRHREAWSEERRSPKSYAAMVEEERAAEAEHERSLVRAKRERDDQAKKSAEAEAATNAARANTPKFVRRVRSGSGE